MSNALRQFVAVLLAIWLPLSSGNALAMAASMPGSGEASHTTIAKPDLAQASSQHHPSVVMDHCATHAESANSHSQSDTGCKHSAACQLAVATGRIDVALPVPVKQETQYLMLFQSQSVAPLDQPPLTRV